MKKLGFKIGLVIISASIIYLIVLISLLFIGNVNWLPNVKYKLGKGGYSLLRLKDAKNVRDMDVIFIGSSHVERAFDPRIFNEAGIRSFNLGSSAQPPFVSYYLLKEHLPKMRPKYVVMDLYWVMLSKEGIESALDIISNSEVNLVKLEMAIKSKDVMLLNGVLVSSLYQIFNPLTNQNQRNNEIDRYIEHGYIESFKSLREKDTVNDLGKNVFKHIVFKPNKLQVEYLHKIIDLCKDNNVKLTFIVTPVTKEYLESVSNYNEYYRLISDIARENNIRLIDYNKKANFKLSPLDDFYDKNHLNHLGVVKFNEIFIKDFRNNINH